MPRVVLQALSRRELAAWYVCDPLKPQIEATANSVIAWIITKLNEPDRAYELLMLGNTTLEVPLGTTDPSIEDLEVRKAVIDRIREMFNAGSDLQVLIETRGNRVCKIRVISGDDR